MLRRPTQGSCAAGGLVEPECALRQAKGDESTGEAVTYITATSQRTGHGEPVEQPFDQCNLL